MKKQDLKTGMVVKTRNDMVWLVINDLIVCQDGYMPLSDYAEDLSSKCGKSWGIISVFEIKSWGLGFDMFDMDNLDNPHIFELIKPTIEFKPMEIVEVSNDGDVWRLAYFKELHTHGYVRVIINSNNETDLYKHIRKVER